MNNYEFRIPMFTTRRSEFVIRNSELVSVDYCFTR